MNEPQGNPSESKGEQPQQSPQGQPSPDNAAPAAQSQAMTEHDKPDPAAQPRSQKSENDVLRWVVYADLAFTAAVAIAAVVQACITNGQLDAMGRQNSLMEGQLSAMQDQNAMLIDQTKLARDQLSQAAKAIEQTDKLIARTELEQRPWLSMDELQIRDLEEGKQPILTLSITNSGKLPGTIDHITYNVSIFDWSNPSATLGDIVSEISGPILDELQRSSIPPGRTYRLNIRQLPVMTKELMSDLNAMKQAICVIGAINYRDPNGQRFVTRGSGFYEPSTNRFILDYNLMGQVDEDE
jgi:hypothetical protein